MQTTGLQTLLVPHGAGILGQGLSAGGDGQSSPVGCGLGCTRGTQEAGVAREHGRCLMGEAARAGDSLICSFPTHSFSDSFRSLIHRETCPVLGLGIRNKIPVLQSWRLAGMEFGRQGEVGGGERKVRTVLNRLPASGWMSERRKQAGDTIRTWGAAGKTKGWCQRKAGTLGSCPRTLPLRSLQSPCRPACPLPRARPSFLLV